GGGTPIRRTPDTSRPASVRRSTSSATGSVSGTYSPSHFNGTFMMRSLFVSELLQEPQVVRPELADVVQAVQQHRDSLRAHAEREAAVPLRVVAAVAQHHRIPHARAENFQPAGALAQAAPSAAADDAVHVHFDARLGEREVAAADADAPVGAEQPPRER